MKESSHWLLRFPSQCVLVAEAIAWERETFRTLETQDRENLSIIRLVDIQILVGRLFNFKLNLRPINSVYMGKLT